MSHSHAHHHGLSWAFALTLGFAGVEAVAGWWSGSLALLGDAGHMVTDAFSLGLAAVAAWLARRPPSERHSYGYVRAEALAALFNAAFMLLVVVAIALEAWERFNTPRPVMGDVVVVVALVGLVINLVVLWRLHGGVGNLNVRGAVLHVVGDLLGSVAALVSGAVILFTGWTLIDPLLSLFICLLLLHASVRLFFEALHELMSGVPRHLDLTAVRAVLADAAGVRSVHDLHVWSLSSGRIALSAHVVVEDLQPWPEVLEDIACRLKTHFGIDHITLQPELDGKAPLPCDLACSGNL